ncbi:cadherin-99C-like, partial [Rhipicephalus sanguineus]
MEAKFLEARVLRFWCALKNPRCSKFPEPSTTASLITISCFWDVKTQLLLLLLRDNLCYLTHGGSSETFTVNEAFPVESIVGTLQVAGNASEPWGDIELRMADPEGSPLTILPGTKSLVLRQKLDKEGRDGLRSVTTDVICSPRHTRNNDHLSITVPVRIIVTDANDNAPEFQGTPYFLNISESTVPGTTVMQGIRAVDKDQPGPFSTVEYYVEDGPYS